MRTAGRPSLPHPSSKHGLARALSKLGYCSRSQGFALVRSGRVRVNGAVQTDPEFGVHVDRDKLSVDGVEVRGAGKVYLMLNKPRGLVTTREDEQGRSTVYSCLEDQNLPWVSPVGRLDKASEGLILFTNDAAWADRITAPASHVEKTYHVQIDRVADDALCHALMRGIDAAPEPNLRAKRAVVLRSGQRNSWLEIILDEGKNRHIRRLLETSGIQVMRLIRVAIGGLRLGQLPKGKYRSLTAAEVSDLRGG